MVPTYLLPVSRYVTPKVGFKEEMEKCCCTSLRIIVSLPYLLPCEKGKKYHYKMGNTDSSSSSYSSSSFASTRQNVPPSDEEESKVTVSASSVNTPPRVAIPTKESSRDSSDQPTPFSPAWKKLLNHVSMQETRSTAEIVEILFRIEERGSTIATEIRAGFVHFMSVCIILGVNPMQLESAGYGKQAVAAATGK